MFAWVDEVLKVAIGLKTDVTELISWWNFSILEHRLNPVYNKVSIKLRL